MVHLSNEGMVVPFNEIKKMLVFKLKMTNRHVTKCRRKKNTGFKDTFGSH